jgi:uncharacterized repeat protein (TIGR02543 family)
MVRERRLIVSAGLLVWLLSTVSAQAVSVTVPGTADPWLAGMPDGSTASNYVTPVHPDVAPYHSPVLVTGLVLVPGDCLMFSASGGVGYGPTRPLAPPDGSDLIGSHTQGAENGISDMTGPYESLVGVFLSDAQPTVSGAPGGLSFSSAASRNYLTLAPELQQVFFIGDGVTGGGTVQKVVVPAGATRLFLGTMDGWGWFNNIGTLYVEVTREVKFDLTTSSGNGGAVTAPGEGIFTYVENTSVPLTATADPHYHFVNWTGSGVAAGDVADPTSASTTVKMHNNFTVQANFAIDQQTLTTSSTGGGTVTAPGQGTFSYDFGTSVGLVAAPLAGYRFAGWTGTAVAAGRVTNPASASTAATMDASYTLVANFAIVTYSLTIAGANGSVTRTPDRTSYTYGETVSLQATANAHYRFNGWSGDLSGAANPATLTMDGDKTVVADFAANRSSLTISSTAGGTVLSPGEGTFQYDEAASVMLEAKAGPLFRFVHWSGSLSASGNPYSLTMDADYTIKACFESVLDEIYVGAVLEGDTQEDGTTSHPFNGIQEAIDVAKDGAKVVIRPGTYFETIDLSGKAIELNGLSGDPNKITPLPVIDGQGKGTVIRCTQGEDANCAIIGLVITGGSGSLAGGILCVGSSPTFQNCLIVGNRATGPDGVGGGIYCQDSRATILNCTIAGNYGSSGGAGASFKDSQAVVVNSIIWGDGPSEIQATGTIQPLIAYTDVAGGWTGAGNFNADPLFAVTGYWANPADLTKPVSASVASAVWVAGDYHVRSQAGRWYPVTATWLLDAVTSPCIDSGNPALPVGKEPVPNGNRINLGVYGGTNQASLTKP